MVTKALLIVEESGPFPLAQADVLGASLLERTTEALLAAGVREISVITHGECPKSPSSAVRYLKASPDALWSEARTAYQSLSDGYAVLLARMDCYCEIDWKRFFARHDAANERLTRAWGSSTEPLNVFIVDPKFDKDADFLFHSRLRQTRMPGARYQTGESEYVHWLEGPEDLRKIAVDGLNLRCEMRPVGREVRPGVWMGEKCRVDAGVRLVAPVYIGKQVRVRTGAVITRGSSLEHHSSIDCGTVVENTSVLPFAAVGAGLDMTHAVIGGKKVADLRRGIAVEIHDPTLINEDPHNAGVRVLAKAASLATYLPLQFWRGLTQSAQLAKLPGVDEECANDAAGIVIHKNSPAEKKLGPASLRPELVMERYGNQ